MDLETADSYTLTEARPDRPHEAGHKRARLFPARPPGEWPQHRGVSYVDFTACARGPDPPETLEESPAKQGQAQPPLPPPAAAEQPPPAASAASSSSTPTSSRAPPPPGAAPAAPCSTIPRGARTKLLFQSGDLAFAVQTELADKLRGPWSPTLPNISAIEDEVRTLPTSFGRPGA